MRKRINVNMRHLRVFVEAARRKSFRAAADSFHLGQPGVSQAIAQLETALNVRLFDRTSRSVRLTEAGDIFFADMERVLKDFDLSVEQLGVFVNEGRHRVRVACLSSAVFRLLPEVLDEMSDLHPQFSVVVDDDNVRGITRKLTSGECSIGVSSHEIESEEIGFVPILLDPFHFVCPMGHALDGAEPLDLAQLDGQSLILLQRGSSIRSAIDTALAQREVDAKVAYETAQIHTLLGMVGSGMGATIIPALLCSTTDGLLKRPLADNAIVRTIGLAYLRNRNLSEGALAFSSVFMTSIRNSAHLPSGMQQVSDDLAALPSEFESTHV